MSCRLPNKEGQKDWAKVISRLNSLVSNHTIDLTVPFNIMARDSELKFPLTVKFKFGFSGAKGMFKSVCNVINGLGPIEYINYHSFKFKVDLPMPSIRNTTLVECICTGPNCSPLSSNKLNSAKDCCSLIIANGKYNLRNNFVSPNSLQ